MVTLYDRIEKATAVTALSPINPVIWQEWAAPNVTTSLDGNSTQAHRRCCPMTKPKKIRELRQSCRRFF